MRLKIVDLTTSALIGIHDHEKEYAQPLIVNVELEYAYDKNTIDKNTTDSGATNKKAIDQNARGSFPPDYAGIEQGLKERIEQHHHGLLEDLAIELAEYLFTDPRILRAEIKLHKPRALQWSRAAEMILTVHRDQDKLHFR